MKPQVALDILRRERIALDDEMRSMSYNAHPTVKTIEYARALTCAIQCVVNEIEDEKADAETIDNDPGKDLN